MVLKEDCNILSKGTKSSESDTCKLAAEPRLVTWDL